MAISRSQLKNWFPRGRKPLAIEFGAWIDSFWHKDDMLPITSIQDLSTVLAGKIEQAALDNEAAIRSAADNSLASAIGNESTARANADTNLQNQIDTNSSNIASNATAIANEVTARQNADTNLQNQINTNSSNIASNATAIANEVTARQNADTNLQNQINTNSSNIASNATAIANEVTARQNADTNLQNQINTNSSNIASNATAISNEVTARQNADTALQNAKADKTTTITINGNTQDLSANRAWTIAPASGLYSDLPASPTAGQQYFCTDYFPGLYTYNSVTAAWDYNGGLDSLWFFEQFAIAPGAQTYNYLRYNVTSGTGTAAVATDTGARFGASLQFNSNAATSTTILLQGNLSGVIGVHNGSKIYSWAVRCSVANTPDATDEFHVLIGTTATSNGSPFIGFSCDRRYSNNWTAITSTAFTLSTGYDAGVAVTATNTGVATNSGWHEFAVLVNEAAGSVRFYIDRVLVATHTTNIPGSGSAAMFSGAIFRKSAGTNSRVVRFDSVKANSYK